MFFPRRPMAHMNPHPMFRQPFGYRPQVMNQRPGFGGLIKRLFKGSGATNQMHGMQGFQGMSGMQGMSGGQRFLNPTTLQGMNQSTLQNLANPANLSAIMGNVQKTLKMAETVVPMVQQYGPLVKNIPAMWKIYSELKGSSSNAEEDTDEQLDIKDVLDTEETLDSGENPTKKRGTSKSVPKLYI